MVVGDGQIEVVMVVRFLDAAVVLYVPQKTMH